MKSLWLHHHFSQFVKSDLICLMIVKVPLSCLNFFSIPMWSTGLFDPPNLMRNIRKKQVCAVYKETSHLCWSHVVFGCSDPSWNSNVRNYRKAFSEAKAQVLIRLHDLMICHRFEVIGSFIHVVTMEEESSLGQDPLKKIRPLQEYIKKKCLSFYQPLQNLSVDERMVKSKARCHLVQYMRNKPCKWGFKYWVLADTSGYTIDFELYTGKMERKGENGLAYDVVMQLCQNCKFQGYSL